MTVLVVALALLSTGLLGSVLGAWAALDWVRRLRPGREGDLLAELATLRASAGLHLAALRSEGSLYRAAGNESSTPMSNP